MIFESWCDFNHIIYQRFSRLSLTIRRNIDECTRRRNTSGTLKSLLFQSEMKSAAEFQFIFRGHVYFILSRAKIKMKFDYSCSRTFQDVLHIKCLYEINYCVKGPERNKTERRAVSQIFHKKQKQKNNNNYAIFLIKQENMFFVIFISIHAIPNFLVGIICELLLYLLTNQIAHQGF